jgi:hypothetical protein
VSDHEDHTVTDQLPGRSDRLLGIAEVVHRGELDLLAEHAASGVQVGHGQCRAALHLLAEPGIFPRHRASHADQNLGLRRPRAQRRNRNGTN